MLSATRTLPAIWMLALLALPATMRTGDDLSGIAQVGPVETASQTLPSDLARALHEAVETAKRHPDDLGYPWADPRSATLYLSAVTPLGQTLASGAPVVATVPTQVRTGGYSWARLEQIKEEVISLARRGVPGAEAITRASPDYEHGRVVITVDRLRPDLAEALARRYGTRAIALRHDPDTPRLRDASRDADTPAFWGGSRIIVPAGGCTAGFPWVSGSTSMMVTAAHCAPYGGTASTPYPWYMGSITASSRENRAPGTGTVYLTGQTVYRGDIALIQMPSGTTSGNMVYRGGVSSSSAAYIDSMWNRSPQVGDSFCTGGASTGELCGWIVTEVRANYTEAGGDYIRNMTIATKQGQCVLGGDSGGPVYTVLANGRVVAKGIISATAGGGSDHWGGVFDPCLVSFTDIWEAYWGFPGVLREV